jgi:NAD(P)H-flavin reductase
MLPHRYRVVGRRPETADTVTLDLEPLDEPIPAARAGQFTMLYAFGVGEAPISIAGLPAPDRPLRHTIRSVGAVTAALTRLAPGDVVGVRGPFGTAWDVEGADGRDVLVVAGGIGLAPLRPVVEALRERPGGRGRATLLVGARSPRDLLYVPELAVWAEDLRVEVTVDVAEAGWTGSVGVVPDLLAAVGVRPEATVAMVCGPEVMMRFTADALLERGIGAGDIRLSVERNMQCAIGHCGHCQLGPLFVCADGPVLPLPSLAPLLGVRSL